MCRSDVFHIGAVYLVVNVIWFRGGGAESNKRWHMIMWTIVCTCWTRFVLQNSPWRDANYSSHISLQTFYRMSLDEPSAPGPMSLIPPMSQVLLVSQVQCPLSTGPMSLQPLVVCPWSPVIAIWHYHMAWPYGNAESLFHMVILYDNAIWHWHMSFTYDENTWNRVKIIFRKMMFHVWGHPKGLPFSLRRCRYVLDDKTLMSDWLF